MTCDFLVFHDDDSAVDELVRAAAARPRHLRADEADLRDAARAREGEVWSPQLLPYEEWVSSARADGRAPANEMLPAQEIGLIYSGARSMGIEREELDAVLDRAVAGSELARPESSAVLAPRMLEGDGDAFALRDAVAVRREDDGYALVGFDLKRFAHAIGSDHVVAVLPASVEGVPIVRITAEAFARRFVQGVGVRLLVVPDTVKRIDASAFSSVSAGCIHLGASVEHMGDQPCDLAGVSPRLGSRAYSVDGCNGRYSSVEGSLFEHDGTRLLFAAPPYAERAFVPEGVEEIGPAALCAGCVPPNVVHAPASLAKVASKEWDDAVWVVPDGAPAVQPLHARGVRLASERMVELDECFYDFDAEGAVLVAGPAAPKSISRRFAEAAAVRHAGMGDVSPSAAIKAPAPPARASLVLPERVEGAPLVRIGVRALPYAPATLAIPHTVRVIERDNACRGTQRAIIPEGVESIGEHCFWSRSFSAPVSIPRSVKCIGQGCFEYSLCRLEHTGSVVHVSADQLLSCFGDADELGGVPFDFAAYDELLLSGKNLPDRLGALIHRAADPHAPSSEVLRALVERLREREDEARRRIARDGERDEIAALLAAGFIDEESFDEQIELLRSCNRTDCVLFLMEEHRRRREGGSSGKRASSRDRFAL
ncbi:MAG: leucine-rich repeat protein [Slackia sp.]|nr:leucine-rich repeat protein [Slackia sp.]